MNTGPVGISSLFDQPEHDDENRPLRPINWNLLRAHEVELEWHELDQWVDWLRRSYGLPASIVPPFWYRHPELVWELSALHLHWLASYAPTQAATGSLAWQREFAASRA